MKIFILFFAVILMSGCGEGSLQSQRWSAATSHGEIPSIILSDQVKDLKADTELKQISDLKVFRSYQKVQGIKLENTWYQEVRSKEGKLVSVNYQLENNLDSKALEQAKKFEASKLEIFRKAKENYHAIENGPVETMEVVLAQGVSNWSPFLKLTILDAKNNGIDEYYLNFAGRVKKAHSYRHDFTNGIAIVYNSAPTDSELGEKTLRKLNGNGALRSDHLSVESPITLVPFSKTNVFQFEESDKEFDLLQAYYFVDQTMSWFEKTLDVSLGYALNIKVHIGGLKPSNAAFFYAGNIRLGEGDGKIYQHIPRDPSIVGHEASHAFVEYLSGLSFEGEAGSYSEAFSDFFTASRLGRPEMGFFSYKKADYKRTIDNDRRADRDLTGGKYNDSLVISGTFWDLKKILGTEKTAMLAKYFLIELGPGGKIHELPEVLTSVARQHLPSEDHHVVESVLEQRGWRNL